MSDSPVDIPLLSPDPDSTDDSADKEAAAIGKRQLSLSIRGSSRQMDAYTVTEIEMDMLSTWGIMEKKAYTIASSLFSFALGLVIQAVFSGFDTLPAGAQILVMPGAVIIFLLSLCAYLIGRVFTAKTVGLQLVIKRQTELD